MSETVECPGCGELVSNVRWPRHFRSDDCESDESRAQSGLSKWGGRTVSADTQLPQQVSSLQSLDGVEIKPTYQADVCGALGCVHEDQLVRVRIVDFGKRVLCPVDAARLVRREDRS
jgi:hypothetical protein